MRNTNLNILITGGARGLGQLICDHCHRLGHSVFVFDKIPFESIPSEQRNAISAYRQINLADDEHLNKVCADLLEKECRIDVLIHNASSRVFHTIEEFSIEEIEQSLQVNMLAGILLVKWLLPGMKERGFGRIINISSASAFHGYSTGSLYCSSKMAMITFTESIGSELQTENKDITINAICPSSFSEIGGAQLQNYRTIVKKILRVIDVIIQTNENGQIIPIFSFKTKLVESTRL
jgi:short-subunit dehydrogenase